MSGIVFSAITLNIPISGGSDILSISKNNLNRVDFLGLVGDIFSGIKLVSPFTGLF